MVSNEPEPSANESSSSPGATDADKQRLSRFLLCAIVLVSAFLSFLIQPLIGKIATAKMGATATIWGACLLFFQLMLVAGYSITFLLSKLKTRIQLFAYFGIAALSLAFMRFPVDTDWKSIADMYAPVGLLWLLFQCIGVPCIMLYTVSGMTQNWCRLSGWKNPYILYSLSNIGSLGALLAYPFAFEPALTLSKTSSICVYAYWSTIILLILCMAILPKFFRKEEQLESPSDATPPALPQIMLWLFLSAAGCITLISFTTFMTTTVAPLPLLWIVPLVLYLLTFILAFGTESFQKSTRLMAWLSIALWVAEPFCRRSLLTFPVTGALVFCFCSFFHATLAAKRPAPKYLTLFYLMLAVGGALGGIIENFVAPLYLNANLEPAFLGFIILVWAWYDLLRRIPEQVKAGKAGIAMWSTMAAVPLSLFGVVVAAVQVSGQGIVDSERNFYGCLTITKTKDRTELNNGNVVHGSQYNSPEKRMIPMTYYSKLSGWGVLYKALKELKGHSPLKVGAIGLGAGTIATYGEAGDDFTFYELDPKIEKVARKYFTFLSDSKATNRVLLGDARKTLENQPPQQFDVLLVDAFTGDSVPTHLLTVEVFKEYLRHLKPDGVIAFHTSNKYVNLTLEVGNLINSFNIPCYVISTNATAANLPSGYVVGCKDEKTNAAILECAQKLKPDVEIHLAKTDPQIRIWTDDFSNVAGILKVWKH